MRIRQSGLNLSFDFTAFYVHITCTQHNYAEGSIPVEDDTFPPQTAFALAIIAGPQSDMIKLKQM